MADFLRRDFVSSYMTKTIGSRFTTGQIAQAQVFFSRWRTNSERGCHFLIRGISNRYWFIAFDVRFFSINELSGFTLGYFNAHLWQLTLIFCALSIHVYDFVQSSIWRILRTVPPSAEVILHSLWPSEEIRS